MTAIAVVEFAGRSTWTSRLSMSKVWAMPSLLMTNNPSKYIALDGYGLEIVDRVQLEVPPTESSRAYLRAKREKLGHLLKLV